MTHFRNLIIRDIKDKATFDSIFLSLHGAIEVVGIARPEAELLRLVRQVVGPYVALIVSLDLHANVDAKLVGDEAANAVFSVKRFLQYDAALASQTAADAMIRILKGTFTPVVAMRKPGIITPSIFQSTTHYPAKDIMERARRWENREEAVFVSVNLGFAYADVPDNGASLFIVTKNDPELANRIADDMNEYFRQHSEAFVFQYIYNAEDGVGRIMQAVADGRTPVVVADGSDRTGSAIWITNELIRQCTSNFCIGNPTDKLFFDKLKRKNLQAGDRTSPFRVGGTTDSFAGTWKN